MHSRGKGIQPRTLEVFDDLGIADKPGAVGTSSGSVQFYTNRHPVAEIRLPEVAPCPGIPYPGLLIVPQFQTSRRMRERLHNFGVMIERGRQLVSFRETADGIVATVKDTATDGTEAIAAAYLAGCDGGRSMGRRQLGLRFDGENHDQYWVLGDMDIAGLDTDVEGHAWGELLPLDRKCPYKQQSGQLAVSDEEVHSESTVFLDHRGDRLVLDPWVSGGA